MATLSSARSALLDLKILLAKKATERNALVAGNQSTTALDANIAELQSAVTTQRAAVRTLSGFYNTARANSLVPTDATTTFDSVPTNGSGNAVQSGGVYSVLSTKQDVFTSETDFTFDDVTCTKLTTSFVDCSGNVTGTLTTATQPNVQHVGPLEGLNVNTVSPVRFESSAISVRTDGTMGVNTPSASVMYELDVGGDVNITGKYRTLGEEVLSSNALGSSITTSGLTKLGVLRELNVNGNVTVDSSLLKVDSVNNRVGIGKDPLYTLDVLGDFNVTGQYLRRNASLLTADTLSPAITTSSLTKLGVLNGANVAGNFTQTSGSTTLENAHFNGNASCTGDLTAGLFSDVRRTMVTSAITDTSVLLQGSHLSWNHAGAGEMDFINKHGLGQGGFYFYNSTGNSSAFSVGKKLMGSITPSAMTLDAYSRFKLPSFRVVCVHGRDSNNGPNASFTYSVTTGYQLVKGSNAQILYDNNPSGSSYGFDRNDGSYIAPVAGKYQFEVYIRLADNSAIFAHHAGVTDNGITVVKELATDSYNFVAKDAGNRYFTSYRTIMSMEKGDRFRLSAQDGGSAVTINECHLSGVYISK